MPQIIDISSELSASSITLAAKILQAGEVIIGPTDTLYGIIANANDDAAIHKIFAMKKRRPDHALPLIAASLKQVRQFAVMSKLEQQIAEHFWPGPLTLILEVRKGIQFNKSCKEKGTIAVRVPANEFNKKLAAASNGLITATSTNISGEQPADHINNIDPDIAKAVVAIFDAGPSKSKQPSTIIRVKNGKIDLIRQGPVAVEDIKKCIGNN
ncbi:MAG: threonylcarbamoyl-AMP synthase [Calditrichaeota bacterium]|nr:MAG: threonylcarbamoyl-AMP synthase [Calditrichota bacterium]